MSPILINTEDLGFQLTSVDNGVPLKASARPGVLYRMAWPAASTHDAWLAYDRNGNGTIDDLSELFGDLTPQPAPPAGQRRNGFLALAQYDLPVNGGNGDGVIDERDAIYLRLRLWENSNHNGISEPSELHSLPELGLLAIALQYNLSEQVDKNGNKFRYKAKTFWSSSPGVQTERWAWDVYLKTELIMVPAESQTDTNSQVH